MQFKENIPLSQIENELNQLWKSRSQANTKASLFNLIIYTHEPRRTAYFQDIARLVMSQFPCRIIFIQGDQNAQNAYLHAKISIGDENLTTPACDLIFFEAAGSFLANIPNLILPYFLPDLPIYLLWGQDPTTENTILPSLQKFAKRLIFDSESCEDLQCFSQTMLKRLESSPIDIIDMNWARIKGWQEVLAHAFDSHERIQQLSSSQTITITYNNRPSDLFLHPDTQTIYLQAWLATQLNWQFKGLKKHEHTLVLSYQSPSLANSLLTLNLVGQRRDNLQAEEIFNFEATDPGNFLYTLNRTGESQVIVHCHTIDRCEIPLTLSLPNLCSGRSFIQEIFYQKPSQQYWQMLNLVSQIAWGVS